MEALRQYQRLRKTLTEQLEAHPADASRHLYEEIRSGRCNRNIRLYKQKSTQQNPSADILVVTDTSERHGDHGEWSTGNTGMRGKFYVRTPNVAGCRAGASKTIRASN